MRALKALPFSILIFLTILLFIPKINGFSVAAIKQQLSEKGAYQQLERYFEDNLTQRLQGNLNPTLINQVTQEITPTYLETATTNALDQTADWVTGKTDQEPTISFNNLKETIQDGPQARQLDYAISQLSQIDTTPDTLPQVTADPRLQQIFERVINNQKTLQSFSQGDATIHLGPALRPLKTAYTIYNIALIVLPILILINLIITTTRAKSASQRLNQLGYTFTHAGLTSAILGLILFTTINTWLLPTISQQLANLLSIASIISLSIIEPLLHQALPITLLISTIIFVLGLILLYLAKKSNPNPNKAATDLSFKDQQPNMEPGTTSIGQRL